MPTRASASQIALLKPRAREYEVGLAGHRGLIITVYPSGSKSYTLRFRQDGVLKRIRLDVATLGEAQAAWLRHRDELRRGEDPAAHVRSTRAERQLKRQAARAAPTVETLAADFIRLYSKRRKRSWRADELMLRSAVLPEWGGIQARMLKRRDVIDLLDRIAARTPVRANRVLAVIRRMFSWAVEREVLEVSPCTGVRRPGTERSRSRVLTDPEIRTFWHGLADARVPVATQHALRFQLTTAQRLGEVVGARWVEIDLDRREWVIPSDRTKNGRPNVVPLSTLALSILSSLSDRDGQFVFANGAGDKALRVDVVTHQLARVIRRLGSAHFTSHDLRRTAATRLAASGTARVVIDAILNHKDASMCGVYDRHSYALEQLDALEAWAQNLREIITDE